MEIALVAVFCCTLVGVLAIVVAVKQSWRGSVLRSYSQMAEELGGVVDEGGCFARPAIEFAHRGLGARLRLNWIGHERHTHYTELHLAGPELHLWCEVFPVGVFARLGRLLGIRDVRTGDPEFDAKYVLVGSSPKRIQALMSAGVRQAIDRLQLALDGGDVFVSFHGDRLLISKTGLVRELPRVRTFVRLCLELCDRVYFPVETATALLDAEPDQPLCNCEIAAGRVPICGVCGEAVVQHAVYCRSCRTPHHEDCWNYFGACSMYGCGQRRFRRSGGDEVLDEGIERNCT